MPMLWKGLQIARDMVPGWDLMIRAAIRSGIGLAAIVAGFEFVGKFCLMLAAITVVGHAEGVFVDHCAGWTRRRLDGLKTLALMPIVLLLLWRQKDSPTWPHDED